MGGTKAGAMLATQTRLLLQAQREELPIASAERQLIAEVRQHETLIVIGETGSGKTTQLPQFLKAAGFCDDGKSVGITQPRRVAAVSVAARVAQEMGVELGAEVGYSIRFEDRTGPETVVKYMTDGMLLREALLDPLLRRYSVVVVDEAHERTLHTDVLLGLLKGVQARRRAADVSKSPLPPAKSPPSNMNGHSKHSSNFNGHNKHPFAEANGREEHGKGGKRGRADISNGVSGRLGPLKVVVMSATLDAAQFCNFFGGAKAVYVQGRQFPVDIFYAAQPEADYLDAVLITVFQIHLEDAPGDILVFLTGQEEIEATERLVRERAARLPAGAQRILVAPIYSAMPADQQMRVFQPAPPGTRKVILATNIAETSLTIPGVRFVVDPGVVKARAYNPRAGNESLAVVPISKAQARQRSGRAGREAPGQCFRLYTEAAFESLEDTTVPEIKRCNLAGVVLQLKAMGIDDVSHFEFMDKPPRGAIVKSLEQLFALGALTAEGRLSEPTGVQMARFPLEPLYSRAVLTSAAMGCLDEMITAVAMLSVEGVFYVPKEKKAEANAAKKRFVSPDGDHVTLVQVFRAYLEEGAKEDPSGGGGGNTGNKKRKRTGAAAWCQANFINGRSLAKAVDVYRQLRDHCSGLGLASSSCGQDWTIFRRGLAGGFFLNAAKRQPDGTYRAIANGRTVSIHPSSVLFGQKPECVIYNELVRTSRDYMRDLTRIDPAWLPEFAPQFYGINDATANGH